MKPIFPALIASLLLAGCASKPDPDVYPLPVGDAFERLQHADIAGFQQAESCGRTLVFTAVVTPPDTIRWRVSTGLADVASFTIRLSPDGDDSTRATIEVPQDLQGGEIYDGAKHYDHPALQQPLRPALGELVRAAMEQRPFDAARLSPPTDGTCAQQRAAANLPPAATSNQAPATAAAADSSSSDNGAGQPTPEAFAAHDPTPLNPEGQAPNPPAPGNDPSPGNSPPAPSPAAAPANPGEAGGEGQSGG